MSVTQLLLEKPTSWTLWVRAVWLFLILNGLFVYRWWKGRRRQLHMEKIDHLLSLFEFMLKRGVKMTHLIEQARKLYDEHLKDLEDD